MSHGKKNKQLPKGDHVGIGDVVTDSEWELRSRCESLHEMVSAQVFPLEKGLKVYDVSMEQYLGYLMMQEKKVKIAMDATVISSMVGVVLGFVDTNPDKIDQPAKDLMVHIRQFSTEVNKATATHQSAKPAAKKRTHQPHKRRERNNYYGKTTRSAIRGQKRVHKRVEKEEADAATLPTVATMIKIKSRGKVKRIVLAKKRKSAVRNKVIGKNSAHLYK